MAATFNVVCDTGGTDANPAVPVTLNAEGVPEPVECRIERYVAEDGHEVMNVYPPCLSVVPRAETPSGLTLLEGSGTDG